MNLGDKLLELRKKKGLSQEEVAFELNVTRQTISKWETNQTTPDFDKIAPLCKLYEISTDELLTGKKTEVVNNDIENKKEKTIKNKLQKQIEEIITSITLIIYLIVSFITMAWHITWILWIINVLICEIVKLIFILKGEKVNDEE